MDRDDNEQSLRLARSIAASGEFKNWRAVEVKLRQLGYEDAGLWFADHGLRKRIDAACADSRREKLGT